MTIQSFKCLDTQNTFGNIRVPRFVQFKVVIERKLRQLNVATTLDDLRSPPGNHLEALAGSRKGQHSIRINKRYRICFVWTDAGPADVEVVDYHS